MGERQHSSRKGYGTWLVHLRKNRVFIYLWLVDKLASEVVDWLVNLLINWLRSDMINRLIHLLTDLLLFLLMHV